MKVLLTLFGSVVLLFSLLLTPHSSLPSAAGQEPKKEPGPKEPSMTIRWFGQSFFQVETSTGRKFAFDPHAIVTAHVIEYALDAIETRVDCAEEVRFFLFDDLGHTLDGFGKLRIRRLHGIDHDRHELV